MRRATYPQLPTPPSGHDHLAAATGMGRHCCRRKRTTAVGRTLLLDLGPANGRSRRPILPVAPGLNEGPLTESTAAAQAAPRERVFMPHT